MARSNHLQLLGGWFSPFTMRVKIAFNIKSLDYENIEETFYPKSQLLLQLNPALKKIPVLLHEDKTISESKIILEYIDEVWNYGHSILPSDPYDCAMARFCASYADDKLYTAMRSSPREEDTEVRKAHLEEIEDSLAKMEAELQKYWGEGKGFWGGEDIGLVDITFGTLVCWLRAIENMSGRKMLVEAKYLGLVKWAERFERHLKVKGLLPEPEKLVEFKEAFRMKKTAAASA